MIRILQILLAFVVTNFFFWPFETTALPGINTKMMLAVLGLLFAAVEFGKRKDMEIPRELVFLFLLAGAVSLASLISITLNQTPDSTYVSYVISFSVWLSAAFATCCVIRWAHGRIGVQLVLDYLVAASLVQCILALVLDAYPALAHWINSRIYFGQDVALRVKRLYGIGALLDVAGLRMAAVLTGLSYYLSEINGRLHPTRRISYIICFLVISVVGNMIARTALVGVCLGLGFMLLVFLFKPSEPGSGEKTPIFLSWFGIMLAAIVVCVLLYNGNPAARKLFRFAFEGFFSLAEKGYWEVDSNEILKNMIVFPETLHTWILGDGYFMNSRYDINYLGDSTDQGFYMGTDVGYLRFIFYFGFLGLIPMFGVILYSAVVCMRHFRREKAFFLLALLVGVTVWFKVSTDIFLYFALFLSAAALKSDEDPVYHSGPVPACGDGAYPY
jgi:hypothetical protein